MRFAAKMTALITMLLAVSLAVGGYLVMSSSFDARLQGQVRDAQEGVRLLGMTVQALCAREQGQDTASSGAIERALEALPQDRSYCLHAVDGTVLFESAGFPREAAQNGRAGVIVSRVQNTTSGSRLITTSLLTLYGGTYSLTCLNDITDMLHEAETELQRFRWILAAVLGAAVAATAALSVYMTRPLRRISRTARQLAAGQTDRRVTVRTDDELGDLAQNFNAMADALEARLRELAAAAQRQKEFTASFAHELKTPLTSVIGYADTLRSRTLPSEMQFEAANAIYTEGKRLERMSFALLDLFALERSEPSFSRVQTGALAASVQKSCEYRLARQKQSLQCDVEEAAVWGEPELLRTLLLNLLDNAHKASPPGAVLQLRGRVVPSGYLFCVIDPGRGIPPEELSRITDPFYMVDKSRARAAGGAGLGLTLCRKIAEVHGSSLRFESVVGEGTRVSFLLKGEQK